MRSISERCSHIKASECQLFIFHKSLPTRELISALEGIPRLETFTYDMTAWVPENRTDQRGPQGPMQSKLAVVGMACRLPGGATTTDEFWEILANRREVYQEIPSDRFNVETHYDPEGKKANFSHTRYGCFVDNPGFFDAPFFNISPKEAEQTDPMQRLALVTAYEALERAGFVPNRTASSHSHRVGTFYGQAADDYREVNAGQQVGTYFIPGGCRAFGPGRINYFFNFWGPSYNIDTACSSSLAAIQVRNSPPPLVPSTMVIHI